MERIAKILIPAVFLLTMAAVMITRAEEKEEPQVKELEWEAISPDVICEENLKQEPEMVEIPYTEEEAYLLAKIAMAEAESESIEGKAMVIMVVLNRVNTEGFPDSIEEVITQERNGVYQFSPVQPGGRWHTVEPNGDCYDALELIESGWDESEGALYFESVSVENSWQSRNRELIKAVGNHNFYK